MTEYWRPHEDQTRTFFDGVVPKFGGNFLTFSLDATCRHLSPIGGPERIEASIDSPAKAADAFAARLDECVNLHLRSDVPVGCALRED
jgi:asparagine synthetase B (glutamine-hydrolysing)